MGVKVEVKMGVNTPLPSREGPGEGLLIELNVGDDLCTDMLVEAADDSLPAHHQVLL